MKCLSGGLLLLLLLRRCYFAKCGTPLAVAGTEQPLMRQLYNSQPV
jgi:hypothetical protein